MAGSAIDDWEDIAPPAEAKSTPSPKKALPTVNDWANIPVDDSDWQDVEAPPVGKLEAYGRGLTQGYFYGLPDEVRGYADALKSYADDAVAGRPLPTLEEWYQPLERSKEYRDKSRADFDRAKDTQPLEYGAGLLTGVGASAVTPGMGALNPVRGAKIPEFLAKGAAQGALGGLGHSTGRDIDEVGPDILDGAGQGAVLSGTFGTLGRGILSRLPESETGGVVEGVKRLGAGASETASNALTTLKRGYEQGVEKSQKSFPDVPFASVPSGLYNAAKEVLATTEARSEFAAIGNQARKLLGPKYESVDDLEILLLSVIDPGPNPAKTWLAQKQGIIFPGQGDVNEYQRILEMGAEVRNNARTFDPLATAKDLQPMIAQADDLFERAKNTRWNQLQSEGRLGFDGQAGDGIVGSLERHIADAGKKKTIPSNVRNVLEDAMSTIRDGMSLSRHGLKEMPWDFADSAERFNRLQLARKEISDMIDWSAANGYSTGELLLRSARGEIDDILKSSPEKVQADEFFHRADGIQKRFFAPTEFKVTPGQPPVVDAPKVRTLLGENDRAIRFRDAVEEMEQFAKDPSLPEADRAQWSALTERLKAELKKAEDRRAIANFRLKASGPSGPQGERWQSITNNNTLAEDAVRTPVGFVNQMDQFAKQMEMSLGKPWSSFTDEERGKAIKFLLWMKKNEGASTAKKSQVFEKLFGTGKAP
jgi:uncharacterized protein (UPF0147 family)